MLKSDARTADLFHDTLPAVRPASPAEATGFEIGWDHAHHRLTPPAPALGAHDAVRQGWQAGSAVFGPRTLKPTPAVRDWLRLRLQAWQSGLAFESVQVTPHFLTQIEARVCPVTRSALTRASETGTDAVVERVSPHAGYAAGNLACLSERARQAKAELGVAQALANAQRLARSGLDTLDGLDTAQWQRLAVLISFATPLPHAEAARLPLAVLPPNRLRLLNPVQALQAVLTLAFGASHGAPALRALIGHVPVAARHDYQVLVLTLQARRLAIGLRLGSHDDALDLRHALEDLWDDAALNRRWQRFALQLDEAGCERLLRAAARRGLGGKGWQWLPQAAATEGWALASGGRNVPAPAWAAID